MPFWAGLRFIRNFLSLSVLCLIAGVFLLLFFAPDAEATGVLNALAAVVFLSLIKALIPSMWLLGGTEILDFSNGWMTYRIGAFDYGWPRRFAISKMGKIRIEESGLVGYWNFGKSGGEPYLPGIVRFDYEGKEVSVGVQPLPLDEAQTVAAELERQKVLTRTELESHAVPG